MEPPVVSIVAPAVKIFEPLSDDESALCKDPPPRILIRPADPVVESPVNTEILPLSPELDVPVVKVKLPLAPLLPALAERILSMPLDVALPASDTSDI
jgi:hypothetical protein